jgi:hypothetical protein
VVVHQVMQPLQGNSKSTAMAHASVLEPS